MVDFLIFRHITGKEGAGSLRKKMVMAENQFQGRNSHRFDGGESF